ncbi:MAG TPA: RNA polymerase subunit sigma-24 [Cyanobacteria bacterium UBA8803]|nr:RNA polymerase subunit sigma-24 [Cyanobacteria bacterium UBA9273]HBL61913.1 RNA polymerase subunit sigma-24 [Cyanobacteria bacterium UBA8803]
MPIPKDLDNSPTMGIQTLRASQHGQAKIKQAREKKGWAVSEEEYTPLKEASKFLIQEHATANNWHGNDSRWLRNFEQLFRVEKSRAINDIKTIIAKSKQGSILSRIEQLIETGEILVKGISYGSWHRFAAQGRVNSVKAPTFKAYCQILGLKWEEIAELIDPQDVKGDEGEIVPTSPPNSPQAIVVYHNLPVRYHSALIGRETEMTQLLELLGRDRLPGPISIEGIGGAGKTSLVLEAAYHCLQGSEGEKTGANFPTFDAIIFTSAKQQHLIGNHILQRHRRERTLHDIFRVIFRTLDCPNVIPVDFEQQVDCIQTRLAQLRTLLIVDNLETLDDREAVLSFLYELPPTVKVVLTTRVRSGLGIPIYLECLPLNEAMRLIEHQSLEQRAQLAPEQCRTIYERTKGLPLGIVYAIGQLLVYGICTDVGTMRLTQGNSDLAQYCFEDSVQRLRGQPAHQLLMGLALFAKSAALDAIAHVALPNTEPLNALAQLYKLRLIVQCETRYDMHPLTREYAIAELKTHPEFEQQARERWVNWYLQFSQPYKQEDWKQWHDYQDLDQEWENLEAVIDWCIHQNRYEQAKQFWQQIKGYTYLRGYWHERLSWIDWLLQASGERQDRSTSAEALIDQGWTLTLMGKPEQLTQVEAWLDRVSHLQEDRDLIMQLELTIDRAVLSIHQRKFEQAHQLLNQGKQLLGRVPLDESKRLRQQIRLDYYQAEVWFETGNYQQAKIGYQKALEQARVAQCQQFEVYILNWLADVALEGEGNLAEAERLLETSMPIAIASKDKLSIAFHQRSRANLEKMKGNLAEFRRWAIEAKAGFEGLGMLSEAQKIKFWLES